MDSSEHSGGLATASHSRSIWKTYVVLTVNALDDDVVLWEVKARSQHEAYEKADAGSHNVDTNLIFDTEGFDELVHEIERMRARFEAREENGSRQ